MTEGAVSETTQKKAAKYLSERRLNVVSADENKATVMVRGTSALPYEVTFNGGWMCDCPARLRCAHIEAASLVVHRTSTVPSIGSASDDDLDALLGLQ